jgi:hypothetical protein
MAGSISINGILKTLLLRGTLPFGQLTSYYGYEAINFPKSTPVYCYAGNAIHSGDSMIGISFGGEASKIKTVGKCEKPEDYLGGFLSIGTSYSLKGQNSQSLNIAAAYNLGFDLGLFNKRLMDSFHHNSNSQRPARKRVRDSIWHLLKYAGSATKEKLGRNYLWLKIISLPLVTSQGSNWQEAIKVLKFSVEEMKELSQRKDFFNLKSDLQAIFQQMKRDPALYKCNGQFCEEIFVDVHILLDALTEAMGTCHSVTITAGVSTSYDILLPFWNSNLHFNFGYSYYGLKEDLAAAKNTTMASSAAFSKHSFSRKSPQCTGIEVEAAKSFGEFLSLLGISK